VTEALQVRRGAGGSLAALHFAAWTALILWLCAQTLFPTFRSIARTNGAWIDTQGTLRIVDFPSHCDFARQAWLERGSAARSTSLYSLENHLKLVRRLAGPAADHSLPFGYSPTMIWLLAPLAHVSQAMAFLLFNLTGLAAAWWATHPARNRPLVGLVPLATPLAHGCLALGRTALLSGAGLLLLSERSQQDDRSWGGLAAPGVAFWALTAKPPLALAAAAVLIGLRRWRVLLVGGGLALLSTWTLQPMLGDRWSADCLRMIGNYNLVDAPPARSWSFVPGHMANLRGVLSIDLGVPDNLASLLSGLSWLLTLAAIAILGRRWLKPNALWALAIICYLVLCPHVTSTEVLQAGLLMPLCLPLQGSLSLRHLALLLLVPLLPLASPAMGPLGRVPLFISLLAVGFVIASRAATDGKDATHERGNRG
jgi:hypothetical protein